MDRFMKYTAGKEPVLSVNLLAAILLGFIVKATEQAGIYQWDEFSLTAAGVITLAVATWLARQLAWAPASVATVTEQAHQEGFEAGHTAARKAHGATLTSTITEPTTRTGGR